MLVLFIALFSQSLFCEEWVAALECTCQSSLPSYSESSCSSFYAWTQLILSRLYIYIYAKLMFFTSPMCTSITVLFFHCCVNVITNQTFQALHVHLYSCWQRKDLTNSSSTSLCQFCTCLQNCLTVLVPWVQEMSCTKPTLFERNDNMLTRVKRAGTGPYTGHY